jgi:cobalt-zinc-cadmium efflux system membrane fusion protein
MRTFTAAMAAIVLSLAAAARVCSEAALPPSADGVIRLADGSAAAREIRVTPAARQALTSSITVTATVEADLNRIAHLTARTAARVVKLVADIGQQLKPGDPVAILGSADLGRAKTEYLRARSLEQIARKHLDREQRLYDDKISSQRDVLEARANHDTALANYKAAREALLLLIPRGELERLNWSQNGRSLSEFALTSPIAGTLVRRDLAIGEILKPDEEVATVIDLNDVWVLASVFEHDVGALRPGERATVVVDAYPNERFSGVVSNVGDVVDRATRTVKARIVVANPQHRLKPGMFARVEIASHGRARDTLAVPASAVFQVRGKSVVFVETRQGAYVPHEVRVGETAPDSCEVLSGLREGDRVVSRGGLALKAMLVNTGE